MVQPSANEAWQLLAVMDGEKLVSVLAKNPNRPQMVDVTQQLSGQFLPSAGANSHEQLGDLHKKIDAAAVQGHTVTLTSTEARVVSAALGPCRSQK